VLNVNKITYPRFAVLSYTYIQSLTEGENSDILWNAFARLPIG